jgi:hypothetical protein
MGVRIPNIPRTANEREILNWRNNVRNWMRGLSGTVVWNPGDLADGDQETSSSITVSGAELGDFVLVSAPYDLQGLQATAHVDAADSVKISLVNETGGNVNLVSGTWKVKVLT